MEFEEIMKRAKEGGMAEREELFLMYRPLILKHAMVNGIFDEDLYQELCVTFIVCVQKFSLDRVQECTSDMELKRD